MTNAKTYSSKSNAARAARKAGIAITETNLVQIGGRFVYSNVLQGEDALVRNGIKRPLRKGVCVSIWEELDSHTTPISIKEARKIATARDWDQTTLQIQFYRHRKFNKAA